MEVRIRDRGRITIPKKVRELLGLENGDIVVLETRGNAVVLRPKRVVSVEQVRGIARHRVVLEEVEEALGHEVH
jgi:AbrB family looped-hinge helix DNA binding protein